MLAIGAKCNVGEEVTEDAAGHAGLLLCGRILVRIDIAICIGLGAVCILVILLLDVVSVLDGATLVVRINDRERREISRQCSMYEYVEMTHLSISAIKCAQAVLLCSVR
jgi:hypothetical protein